MSDSIDSDNTANVPRPRAKGASGQASNESSACSPAPNLANINDVDHLAHPPSSNGSSDIRQIMVEWQAPEPPAFRPHRWFRGPHAQTLSTLFWPDRQRADRDRLHEVPLDANNRLAVLDGSPPNWQPGDRVVVMLHGLAGSADSPPLTRMSYRLQQAGFRTFRLNQRNVGVSLGWAQDPFHAGRIDDITAVLMQIVLWCPGSPVTLVGLSLGGAMLLRWAGEIGQPPSEWQTMHGIGPSFHRAKPVDSLVAVCPPLDLARSVQWLETGPGRIYNRYFARVLSMQTEQWVRAMNDEDAEHWISWSRRPQTMREFDSIFTKRAAGLPSAEAYYAQACCRPYLQKIKVPTAIFASQDDPVVETRTLLDENLPEHVRVHLTEHGGHLGFLADQPENDPDRRWVESRVVEWIISFNQHVQHATNENSNAPAS